MCYGAGERAIADGDQCPTHEWVASLTAVPSACIPTPNRIAVPFMTHMTNVARSYYNEASLQDELEDTLLLNGVDGLRGQS